MLRRDLLKGILGLVGGGLLLNKVQEQDSSTSSSHSISESSESKYIGVNINNSYCRNEFRIFVDGNVRPGDRLYSLCDGGGATTKKNDNYIGIALSNKDKWECCQVALYLS